MLGTLCLVERCRDSLCSTATSLLKIYECLYLAQWFCKLVIFVPNYDLCFTLFWKVTLWFVSCMAYMTYVRDLLLVSVQITTQIPSYRIWGKGGVGNIGGFFFFRLATWKKRRYCHNNGGGICVVPQVYWPENLCQIFIFQQHILFIITLVYSGQDLVFIGI